jgi:hypothetical protein
MKNTPEMEKLDNILRSSRIVAGGFMGPDHRDIEDVTQADTRTLEQLGYSLKQVAVRMQQITDTAKKALGVPVEINTALTACVDEAKGKIVCPWPHPASFDKRLTTVTDADSSEEITWSDLHIHMIAEHGFFEGLGSKMRIEPEKLIKLIF